MSTFKFYATNLTPARCEKLIMMQADHLKKNGELKELDAFFKDGETGCDGLEAFHNEIFRLEDLFIFEKEFNERFISMNGIKKIDNHYILEAKQFSNFGYIFERLVAKHYEDADDANIEGTDMWKLKEALINMLLIRYHCRFDDPSYRSVAHIQVD